MSRSYRTQKRSVIAERRVLHASAGKPQLPRIVERKPYPGDSHPISKKYLQKTLLNIPIEYLYGLRKIELLPRCADVGEPYAWYRLKEKSILLYSLPMTWNKNKKYIPYARGLCRHWDAQASENRDFVEIHWPSYESRELWFFITVLMHELGHHYRNQYKTRDKKAHYKIEELIANLHSIRFFRRKLRALRSRRHV